MKALLTLGMAAVFWLVAQALQIALGMRGARTALAVVMVLIVLVLLPKLIKPK